MRCEADLLSSIFKSENILKSFLLPFVLVAVPSMALAEPLYPNSVVSNDLDFIQPNDPGACWSIEEKGSGRTEMFDPRTDELFVEGAIQFNATYPGQTIRINVHPDVADPAQRAEQAAASMSRLPVPMRRALRYVNIHDGDGTAWAEHAGRFFTLYDDNMAVRLSEHDLDETVFHETAHVALDPMLGTDPDWASNAAADGGFITEYAARLPDREDIAESALFAWTMTFHPGRLPADIEAAVRQIMPNRLEYLGNVMEEFEPPSC